MSMNVEEVARLSLRWLEGADRQKMEPISNLKFVTGDYDTDLKLHHFEQDSGIRVTLSANRLIANYEIVDEEKFTWFMLKWA